MSNKSIPLPAPKPRQHQVSCAVFDPSPARCDCGSLPKVYDADDLREYGETYRRDAGAALPVSRERLERLLSDFRRAIRNRDPEKEGLAYNALMALAPSTYGVPEDPRA